MRTEDTQGNGGGRCPAPPPSLISRHPARWLSLFGPGAVVASLSIGTGELIFSTRGGAIFGYRILFLFLAISVFKWVLLFSAARHIVLTGVHPLRRWMELPVGPRGWLPAVMFLFAAICIPIWVSFHCSVLGDLLAELTGSHQAFSGASVHLWGMLMLGIVTFLAVRGGYAALERVQLFVIGLMMGVVCVALVLLRPDWQAMLLGTLIPQPLTFPEWLLTDSRPMIQSLVSQPVWVEATLYVGVIGGASFDYLAYVAFLREKGWGVAGADWTPEDLQPAREPTYAADDLARLRVWVRAPLVDCTLSFLTVFIFSAVFVASGWLILAPEHQIPGDGSFLRHQAQFLTRLHPWLYPLYVAGTFLTLFGTLYGTLEIAPTLFRECYHLLRADRRRLGAASLRGWSLRWTAGGAALILIASFWVHYLWALDRPPGLTALLIPANLFTGVLSCGIICMLNPWMAGGEPQSLRLGASLSILNVLAGGCFLFLGLKGYWDYGGALALGILLGTLLAGFAVAWYLRHGLVGESEYS